MSYELRLPELGTSAEIYLAAWLKQPGESVEAGEIIAEALTEKVNTEIPSPIAAIVEALLVDEGDQVVPGQVIARLAARAS